MAETWNGSATHCRNFQRRFTYANAVRQSATFEIWGWFKTRPSLGSSPSSFGGIFHIVSSDERPGVCHHVSHDLVRRLDRADSCNAGTCCEAHLLVVTSRLRGRQHCAVGRHFVRSPEHDRLADQLFRGHVSLLGASDSTIF